MPSKRATPAGKQRVRTGCLTCRRRRRKCDERKPRCENCAAKSLVCKYAPGLTFITVSHPGQEPAKDGAQQPNDETEQANSPIAPVVVDDDDNHAPIPSTPVQDQARVVWHQTWSTPIAQDDRPAVGSATAIPNPGPDNGRIPWHETTNTVEAVHALNNVQNSAIGSTASNNHETDLLRHFRYMLASWLDVGDPECSFGIKMMLVARSNRPLFASILALAAYQRSLVAQSQNQGDFESSLQHREEAASGLEYQNHTIKRLGQSLLMLGDYFSSGPLQWRNVLFHQITTLGGLAAFVAREGELDAPLFWLHFRLDLAGSILTSSAPLIPFTSSLHDHDSPRTSFRRLPYRLTEREVHQQALLNLASCLSLTFGERGTSLPRLSELTPHYTARRSDVSSQWLSLWSDCQKWYHDRPVEVQQILDIRGVQADQVDPESDSSFPILIYTTPLALVSNAVYHITSLLLLSHKPRLSKPLAGHRSFHSPIWHALSIAGIAMSNESFEQWDPILIAGLLLVSKQMTHESQQSMLSERLVHISATTGIKLDHEIENLRLAWNMSRYDEEGDDNLD